MHIYAQLNENRICTTVCSLPEEIEGENVVRLDEWREDILGKSYQNGQWVDVPVESVETIPEPHIHSVTEVIQAVSDLRADLEIAGVI